MPGRPFFYKETHGMRITVRPLYLPEQSRPVQRHYVFAYFVRIENIGEQAAQLLSRRSLIHPGQVHEYQSFCVLKSPDGYMEGQYFFVRQDDSKFTAEIPRFQLRAEGA